MLDKIFIYEDLKNCTLLYLNGPYGADSDKLLDLYINWHNNEFIPYEPNCDEVEASQFKFSTSVCAIDFYEEYK